MPVEPKPQEDKNTFISRCISEEVGKGMPNRQAVAVCISKWARRNIKPKK